jgi:hypothetical protein
VLDQIAYCAEVGAGAVMPASQFWLETNDRDWQPFLKDCCQAAGEMGVVHYNTARAKRVLSTSDYAVCARELPLLWCQLHFETP